MCSYPVMVRNNSTCIMPAEGSELLTQCSVSDSCPASYGISVSPFLLRLTVVMQYKVGVPILARVATAEGYKKTRRESFRHLTQPTSETETGW